MAFPEELADLPSLGSPGNWDAVERKRVGERRMRFSFFENLTCFHISASIEI